MSEGVCVVCGGETNGRDVNYYIDGEGCCVMSEGVCGVVGRLIVP